MGVFLTLHSPRNAHDWYARGLWQPETFYALLTGHTAQRPDAAAIRDGRRTLSWRELQLWADAIAEDLTAQGLIPGDRVSIWMSNRVEAVAVFLACARQGFACNPSLHRTFTCGEVGLLLNPLATPAWDDPDSVRYLAFTSGTTGTPKCVMHSDNTLLANARDMVRDWKHGTHTRILTLSPLSHHIAWVAVAEWLLTGGVLILDDPPAGTARIDWLLETGATYVMGVPTHAMDLLLEQQRRGLARLGKVEVFYMAGAPIPPSTAEAFVKQDIKPQNVYGMTENSSHQYTHPSDPTAIIVTTCGRGGPAYEVKLFDPADMDREVP